MTQAAIIIFCFNRPDSLSRLLTSISGCAEASATPIYVFIDGPRHDNEAVCVNATRAVAQRFDHPNTKIIQRKTNLGLKQSLTTGISEVMEHYDSAIILEDDLILGPHALTYFLRGLDIYQQHPQVVSICGYAIGAGTPGSDDACFMPMTHPWGWATWKDRWQAHTANTLPNVPAGSPSYRTAMNVFGLRDYRGMLKIAQKQMVSSWWIYWQLNAVQRHGLSLFPSQSHVRNNGISETGTHSSRLNFLRYLFDAKNLATRQTVFPQEIVVDFNEIDRCKNSKEARLLRIIGFLGMVKRYLKRIKP